MRVLITGIAGHIGSALARYLIEKHPASEIVGVDDFSSGYPENVPPGVEFHNLSLAVPLGLRHIERYYDVMVHCAAFAAECASRSARRYTYKNNVLATAALLNLAENQGCGRFVFLSSAAVYGEGRVPFCESSPVKPRDPYGISKLASELDVQASTISWTILRLHNVYGPGQSLWQQHRSVLGIWMRAACERQPLIIFGDGKQVRSFSFIDDILPAVWRACWWPGAARQVINLGGSSSHTILSLAELVATETGAVAIKHEHQRCEVRDVICLHERANDLLAYQDRVSIEDGVRQMWRWAKKAWSDHPARRSIPLPYRWETAKPEWA